MCLLGWFIKVFEQVGCFSSFILWLFKFRFLRLIYYTVHFSRKGKNLCSIYNKFLKNMYNFFKRNTSSIVTAVFHHKTDLTSGT